MAIQPIMAVSGDMPMQGAIPAQPVNGSDFSAMLGDGIARVDASLAAADAQLRGLAAGQDIPLHEVMISMEKARIDLTLMAEVRNRVLESYQELMRMQL